MSSPDPNPSSIPTQLLNIPYSSLSSLNTLDIHFPRPLDPKDTSKYWIIYIHGGAWRDPLLDSASVVPTILRLLSSGQNPNIAAVASLNYRLSPYPSHPSHPSSPNDPSRNAKHPSHIEDVLTAIAWLQARYGFGQRYLLVGHSCGATMAFQVGMGLGNVHVELPKGILGVEGIYDLKALRDNHLDQSSYQTFIEGAFGMEDEGLWEQASPVTGKYCETWRGERVAYIAHSKEDELVEWAQVDKMAEAWEMEGGNQKQNDFVILVKGRHHEIWKEGTEMARVIEKTVEELVKMH